MNDKPEIKSVLTDENILLKICNISERAFLGLINSGADSTISKEDINFGNNLKELGYNYNVTLFLPNNIFLDGKNIYTWNETIPISGKFKSDNVKNVYSNQNKNTVIRALNEISE